MVGVVDVAKLALDELIDDLDLLDPLALSHAQFLSDHGHTS